MKLIVKYCRWFSLFLASFLSCRSNWFEHLDQVLQTGQITIVFCRALRNRLCLAEINEKNTDSSNWVFYFSKNFQKFSNFFWNFQKSFKTRLFASWTKRSDEPICSEFLSTGELSTHCFTRKSSAWNLPGKVSSFWNDTLKLSLTYIWDFKL